MSPTLSYSRAAVWLIAVSGLSPGCSSDEPSEAASVGVSASTGVDNGGPAGSLGPSAVSSSSTGATSTGQVSGTPTGESAAGTNSTSSSSSSEVTAATGASSDNTSGAGGSTGADAANSAATLSTTGASAGSGGGASTMLAWSSNIALWTGVRYYSGGTPSNRTSGPQQGPRQEFVLTNESASEVSVELMLAGADADKFQLEDTTGANTLQPGATLIVPLSLTTDNSQLGAAPAQDDGATVLRADLIATSGTSSAALSLYALVLTYVELEPTFGQIMAAFPYQVNLGTALETDANPNPATLPGVETGTDEVAAPTFQKADPTAPVTLLPLARFSPPGAVPYGWYPPGNPGQAVVVAELGAASDPHTNNQSRMLEPPLASGAIEFEPGSDPFSIFIEPDGQATIYSEDAQNSDGQHRLKVFLVHDAQRNPVANTYLLGGEEAANGDYQDYVLLLGNVSIP